MIPTPQENNDAEVLSELKDGVLTLTLNRPAKFNALSGPMIATLQAAFDTLPPEARCVVIAGTGKALCAGHDLAEMRDNRDRAFYEELFAAGSRLMQAIVACPVPVICRVHGMAFAAGVQLVCSCDLAIAGESATFAVSGVKLGLFCSTPAVALSRNVAPKRAFDLLITGRPIGAREALEAGIVGTVVPDAELDAAVARLAGDIVAKSPVAVRAGKAVFGPQRGLPLAEAYDYAGRIMVENAMSQDAAEGMAAFTEKRPPVWTGR